jgi:hypothetical protein
VGCVAESAPVCLVSLVHYDRAFHKFVIRLDRDDGRRGDQQDHDHDHPIENKRMMIPTTMVMVIRFHFDKMRLEL